MAKKTFQDVVPKGRSIRDIELPSRRRNEKFSDVPESVESAIDQPTESKKFERKIEMKRPTRVMADVSSSPVQKVSVSRPRIEVDEEEDNVSNNSSYEYTYDEPKKSSRSLLYVACGILLLALAFGISAFFKSASITITPKHETRAVAGTLNAEKDATSGLGFQIVTVTKDAQIQVAAGASTHVETKASGTLVIYNNTASSQKLIATTRFQTASGLVYRLQSAITIPARTGSGSTAVAGKIEALVVADKAGAEYNIGLSDFTLPALKGDPKYSTIYARSKTPMSGGFSGSQKTISSDASVTADATLQSQLKDSLQKDIALQIPANFILFPADVTYSFTPSTQTTASSTSDQSMAILQKKGTAQAIIFDKAALSAAIVARVLPDATSSQIKVDNLADLIFTYATSSAVSGALSKISFSLSGNGNFVWMVDQNKLKSDLLGLTKTQAQAIIAANYKAIQEAWIETRPFWNQTIPLSSDKVTLTNSLEK